MSDVEKALRAAAELRERHAKLQADLWDEGKQFVANYLKAAIMVMVHNNKSDESRDAKRYRWLRERDHQMMDCAPRIRDANGSGSEIDGWMS